MKLLLLVLISLMLNPVFSGNDKISEWSYELHDRGGDKYEIVVKAKISEDWYIYGMNIPGDEGPLPLFIGFDESESIEILEDFYEKEKPSELFDAVFNMKVTYYDSKSSFKSVIRTENLDEKTLIIDGQACYKRDGTCVQVYEEIQVKLN